MRGLGRYLKRFAALASRLFGDEIEHKQNTADAPYGPLPKGQRWVKETVWTCPVHDEPDDDYHDCDCTHCTYVPERERGCTCESKAKWKWTGRYRIELDLFGISAMLRDVYMPSVMAQLNEPGLLMGWLSSNP